MGYMFLPLRRYADFNGRSRRKEFWLWTLFNFLVVGALAGILVALLVSATYRVGERGGIRRVDPVNTSYAPPPADTPTYQPAPPPADEATNEFATDPSLNTATDSPEEEPDVSLNYRAYSSYDSSFSYRYEMDPFMFLQELGAGGWIVLSLMMLYTLLTFIPTLAVTIRRLHDTNKSGWFYLLNFVPLVGPIILLVFYLTEGTRGPNEYGPDPKYPVHPGTFA
jgi:uncharacterized membrane protein YhaH (DUF805 family)